jgi:hypothetical protein
LNYRQSNPACLRPLPSAKREGEPYADRHTLQHALFDAMRDAAIFHQSLENFDRVSAAELSINDLVVGHFDYQHVAKMRPDRFLITLLRDPIERVIFQLPFSAV